MCINLAMILVSIYRWFSNSKYIVKFHSFHIMFSFYFQGWTIFILKMLKTDKNEPFKGIRVNYKFSNLDVNGKFWKLLCENVIVTLNTVTGCSKLIWPSWRCPSNLSCEEEALQGKGIFCWNCLDTGICLAHICHNPDLSHTSHNLFHNVQVVVFGHNTCLFPHSTYHVRDGLCLHNIYRAPCPEDPYGNHNNARLDALGAHNSLFHTYHNLSHSIQVEAFCHNTCPYHHTDHDDHEDLLFVLHHDHHEDGNRVELLFHDGNKHRVLAYGRLLWSRNLPEF